MRDLFQDIRYALRGLIRAPGFTSVAILTLALGIGANTAIFTLVYAVILKPLPFRDPGKLIVAWDTYRPQFPKLGVSPVEVEAWQQQTDLLEQTAWYRYVSKDLAMIVPGSEAFEVHATFISASLFPMLGVAPALGRAFAATEAPTSVLLSHRLWQGRFGGNPAVIGKAVRLNDQEFTVAGVMPADFQFPDWADVWLPQGPLLGDELTNPVRHALGFIARLSPRATSVQAKARFETISARLAGEHPKTSTGFGIDVSGLQEDLTASTRPALLMLLGAAALVLLIVCANVANLLLARASGRTREMAVRIALGAGAWRIVRQLLTESIVLASLGGAAGLALAQVCLVRFAPIRTQVDSPVLFFLLIVCVGNGVACGLAPAFPSPARRYQRCHEVRVEGDPTGRARGFGNRIGLSSGGGREHPGEEFLADDERRSRVQPARRADAAHLGSAFASR